MKFHRMTACLLSAALVLSLAACGGEEPQQEQETAAGIAVQVHTVAAERIATENRVTGKISADNESTIMIANAAKCLEVYAEAGDRVEAGDKICKLDFGSTLASYNAAKINYHATVQSYNDQKNILDRQVKLAADNVENTKALFEIGAASQLEIDQAELNYENAVAGRNSALSQLEAGIQNAKSGLEQLNVVMDDVDMDGNVIAPASGVLTTMNAVENAFISNTMPLAVIDGAEQMKVTASVSEVLVPKLAAGDEATVYVSSAEQTFTATIRSVERSANMQTKLYTVVLTVPADVSGLLSGMFADITFHTDVAENAIVIPTQAILTSNGVEHVFVVENGTAKRVEITTGMTGSGVTEVLSGLTVDQQVVIVGQPYLMDGDAVRVVSGDALPAVEQTPAEEAEEQEAAASAAEE